MKIVSICQEQNWGYWQYQKQPRPIVELLALKMRLDEKKRKKEINKSKNK